MSAVERIQPLITPDQLTELVAVAVTSKTNELELAVAKAINMMMAAPFIVDPSMVNPENFAHAFINPGSILVRQDV